VVSAPPPQWSKPLTVPHTPLVGRNSEVALVSELLQRAGVSLVTLLGPGGIGKTRLALQLVSELGPVFPDGVVFIDLAPIRDPALVLPTIARDLGVLQIGDQSLIDHLGTLLQDRVLLLVLDNCEQIADAAPALAELLQACPAVTVLATSRQLLRLSEEQVVPVVPLEVPDLEREHSLEDIARTPAVQLFVQRAWAADGRFALTAANAATVAEVVRRVDGLPLAIELAAARVPHLALAALLTRLERRLPLLTGGWRDRPRRLQTMRDAIAWSYDLLSPDEQTLFRRLAVFIGGFTLDAAEYIGTRDDDARSSESAADVDHSPRSVLDLLGSLVDKSLLLHQDNLDGSSRYHMLETIREFGLERLAAGDEAIPARRAHATYFLAFAERWELGDLLPEGDRVLVQLEAEQANLRAVLEWLDEAGEPALLMQLAAALGRFWIAQTHYQEGRYWMQRALAHERGAAADRAKALIHLGMIATYQGANGEAETYLWEGLTLCRDQSESFQAARALMYLGGLATMQGDYPRGMALLEESLTAAQAVADRRLAGIVSGWTLNNLAIAHRAQGNIAPATAHLGEALDRMRDAGFTAGTIMALGDLGDLVRDQGDYARALSLYREALVLGRESSGKRVVFDVIEAVGIVTALDGQAERGARLLGAVEAQRARIGLRYRVVENQVALDKALAASRAILGDLAFETAWAAGEELKLEDAVAEALDPTMMPAAPPRIVLTPREREILQLLVAGHTDRAIADALFISARTVQNHIARIFDKLGVRTRTAAATAAVAAALVDLPPSIQP
jgi:non-specific serine/threonine protein kinase